jgi:hypothetical protein
MATLKHDKKFYLDSDQTSDWFSADVLLGNKEIWVEWTVSYDLHVCKGDYYTPDFADIIINEVVIENLTDSEGELIELSEYEKNKLEELLLESDLYE